MSIYKIHICKSLCQSKPQHLDKKNNNIKIEDICASLYKF